MTVRELQGNIRKTKDFTSLWVKFHDLYNSASKKKAITQEEEDIFLETKSLVTGRYEDLKRALKINRATDGEMRDVISHVLSLKSMAAMSDKALEKIEEGWKHSHVFLNNILKILERRSEELAQKKRFPELAKRVFSSKIIQIVALVTVIFVMMYGLRAVIRIIVR